MRRLSIALIFVAMAVIPAAGQILTPSRADLERIDLLIADANGRNAALVATQQRIRTLAGELRDATSPDERAKKTEELEVAREKVRTLAKERTAAYDEALALAIDATGIGNPWPDGRTLETPFAGQYARWKPVSGPNADIPWTGPDGSPVIFPKAVDKKTGKQPIARTLPNGLTIFHPQSFTNAEELILTVAHEYRHFEQLRDPDYSDKTASEREAAAYKYEIELAETMPWRDPSHQSTYTSRLKAKGAEKQSLAVGERELKDRGELVEIPNVRKAPGLYVDITPIFTRTEQIRKSVSEASVRSHFGTLSRMAWRDCNESVPTPTREFDALPKLRDQRYYEKEKLRFEGQSVAACEDRRYLSYLSTLARGERIYALPHALPPMQSPFPPPAAPLPAPPGPEAPPVLVPHDGVENLRQLIRDICADPAGFTRPASWKIEWFPQPRVRLFLQRAGDGRCEGALGMHVMEQNQAGDKLDLADLARRASLYKPSPIISPPGKSPPGGCGPANPGTDIIGCPTPR